MNKVEEYLINVKKLNYTMSNEIANPIGAKEYSDAYDAKKSGDYEKAIDIYLNLMNDNKIASSLYLQNLYKILASACYIPEAYAILTLSNRIFKKDYPNVFSNQDDHLNRLKYALRNEKGLIEYLSLISGNLNYKLAKDYKTITSERLDIYIGLL